MAGKLEDLAQNRGSQRREPRPQDRTAKDNDRGCPVCGLAVAVRYRPFCSARCADIDLARWLNEGYRIPDDPRDHAAETEKPETD